MMVADIRKLPTLNKDTAGKILGYMREILDKYGWVSVADVCDLMCVKSYYEDVVVGWSSLDGARLKRVWRPFRFRYKLILPAPSDIRAIRKEYMDEQSNRGDDLE